MDETVKFFYDNAGYSYNAATETPEQGRLRCARDLARAEARRKAEGAWVAWCADDIPFDDDVHGPDEYGYVATLWQYDPDSDGPVVLASLGSVDGELGSDYHRVIEAELASEAWPE